MLSILAIIRGIYRKQVKCNYLKNQKFFVDILLHFEYSWKKLDASSLNISEIIHSVATWMHSRSCLKTPFGNQRVNKLQTLQKSTREHFYPILSKLWHR